MSAARSTARALFSVSCHSDSGTESWNVVIAEDITASFSAELGSNAPQKADQALLDCVMLAQDTGGAIRGAVRADYFWGFGDEAGREAGRMRQQGRMWILWPKDAGPPAPAAP